MKQHNIKTFSSRDDANLTAAVAWLDEQSREGWDLVTAYTAAHPVTSIVSHCYVVGREVVEEGGGTATTKSTVTAQAGSAEIPAPKSKGKGK